MALESVTKHKRIFAMQSRIVGIATGIIMMFSAAGALLDNHSVDSSKSASQYAQQRVEFWNVVAGTSAAQSISSSNKLASDLHLALQDPTDPTKLPDTILNFRAAANEYGGVDSEIGFNPFDHTGMPCTVCGPLNSVMLNNLSLIQNGQVNLVIDKEPVKSTNTQVNWTPFDLSGAVWFGSLYVIISTGAIVFAVRRDAAKHQYDSALLNWNIEKGEAAQQIKFATKILSFAYFLVVHPFKSRYGKGRERYLREMGIQNATRELHALYEDLNSITVPSNPELQKELIRKRERVRALLESSDEQTESYSNGRVVAESSNAVANRLSNADRILAANAPVIEARQAALIEMKDE